MDGEKEALKHFKKVDPTLYEVAKRHQGAYGLRIEKKRTNDALFAKLASSVVSQQLSTKAAASIWGRLKDVCGGKVTAESIQKITVPRMRKAGLSAAKVKTLKELSKAVLNGLSLTSLARLPEEESIQKLTSIWGIGTWTAEMFLIFALGRMDVFSPGDLGLLRAIEDLYGVPKGSHRNEYIVIAEKWSPYRSVACVALWRHWDTV